jgi:hypothetical protein
MHPVLNKRFYGVYMIGKNGEEFTFRRSETLCFRSLSCSPSVSRSASLAGHVPDTVSVKLTISVTHKNTNSNKQIK